MSLRIPSIPRLPTISSASSTATQEGNKENSHQQLEPTQLGNRGKDEGQERGHLPSPQSRGGLNPKDVSATEGGASLFLPSLKASTNERDLLLSSSKLPQPHHLPTSSSSSLPATRESNKENSHQQLERPYLENRGNPGKDENQGRKHLSSPRSKIGLDPKGISATEGGASLFLPSLKASTNGRVPLLSSSSSPSLSLPKVPQPPQPRQRPLQQRNQHLQIERQPQRRDLRSLASLGSSSNLTRRRVLRYGETLESLFRLDATSSEEQWRLCRSIVDGTAADDASVWLRVLDICTATADTKIGESDTNINRKPLKGVELIRLYRRATSRFVLSDLQENAAHSEDDRPDILAIWLSYAKMQATYGAENDARQTLKGIQRQQWVETFASFYLTLADLEQNQWGNLSAARDALRLGIRKNAQPLQRLREAEEKMTKSTTITKMGELEKGISEEQKSSAISQHVEGLEELPVKPSPKRELEQGPSPKRQKTETCALVDPSLSATNEACDIGSETNGDSTRVSGTTEHRAHSRHGQEAPSSRPSNQEKTANVIERKSVAEVTQVSDEKEEDSTKSNNAPQRMFAQSHALRFPSKPSKGSKLPKQKLISSLRTTSQRVACAGLTGKAKRVDPSESMDFGSESESESESLPGKKDVGSKSSSKPVKKITKFDLGYMWEWDPDKRQGSGTKQPSTRLEKIDEASSSISSGLASAAPSNQSTSSSSRHRNWQERSNTSDGTGLGFEDKTGESESSGSRRRQRSHHTPGSPHTSASSVHPDFRHLVRHDNMLVVNNLPYAKLDVIGKGGSCKVYRGLSKQGSVVAIKKVKIGDVNERTIEGYANEIELLKRLRGNPSIIEMFDSEISYDRKAIFLVMEPGEVDLNKVLAQQELASSARGDGRRRLDMNFIRLTWQQMLGAVHCIHEERIIHGDLKPANFLFVRGALKLIDFGIAKAIQSNDTTNIYRDIQHGTLNYMCPEAFLATETETKGAKYKLGRASDIWSLGCILYQLVYGKTPFAEIENMLLKLQAIVNENHKIRFPKGVDEDAVDAMKQCLKRKPAERPPIVGPNGLLNAHKFLNS